MFSLIIESRLGAEQILSSSWEREQITHLASIFGTPITYDDGKKYGESPCDGFDEFGGKKLALQFDDIQSDCFYGYIGPSEKDVLKIIAFGNIIKEDLMEGPCGLLVHCHAGISRSTAAAFIIAYIILEDKKKAMELVFSVRPQARPNSRMIMLMNKLIVD